MNEQLATKVDNKNEINDGKPKSLTIDRVYTTVGIHPYDEVDWERREVIQTNWKTGETVFHQRGVEFPVSWSLNASTIVTTKYFRGALNTEEREWSLKQVIDRVVGKYVEAAIANNYMDEENAVIFEHELTWMLLHQVFSFNSPVWFNVGTKSPQQVSACFILAVEDSMDSILNWYREEGFVFKGGSGAGLNLSKIRGSKEHLRTSGGIASGPVSFMRGADASAGAIKSGGATRRAAKMVILDVDHPDIEEFIETKASEERKIRALRDAGFDMDLGGKDIASVQFQNANNSVRVSDKFLKAVEDGTSFDLIARLDGSVVETIDAKALWRKIAQAAWECADPGVQYDDTINHWHTNSNTGKINGSNPCFPADQRVVTNKGLIRIGELVSRASEDEDFKVYTNDVTNSDNPENKILATVPTRYMENGVKEILELKFNDGSRLRATPNHRLWTTNGWVRAEDLTQEDKVVKSVNKIDRNEIENDLSEAVDAVQRSNIANNSLPVTLPKQWNKEFAHYLGWLVGDGCITNASIVTVYGTEDDKNTLVERHSKVIESIIGRTPSLITQANGTSQLKVGHKALRIYLKALGFSDKLAPEKTIPESIFQAPEEAVVAFLQGLYDADGCVVDQEDKGTRYVGVSSRSEELALGVQELLASLGIHSRIYTGKTKENSFNYTRKDGSEVSYSSTGPSYDVRLSGKNIARFKEIIGFALPKKAEKLAHIVNNHEFYEVDETITLLTKVSIGKENTYNLTEPRNHSYIVSGIVVANCSEYLSLDNSSCNLASLNLMKFQKKDGSFDSELFVKATELVITAMEVSISFADFPTEAITKNTHDYRQLGIGYANLGALLMSSGLAYDSTEGRAYAAAITSLMTGVSYRRSAEIAGIVGPYAGYVKNKNPHTRVMEQHRESAKNLLEVFEGKQVNFIAEDIVSGTKVAAPIAVIALEEWDRGLEIGKKNGWRNAQASVLAPTGTISFMLDCDTTGVEPDFSLIKSKKLVGGSSMRIINNQVDPALRSLGYQNETIEAIEAFIADNGHVINAPGLKLEHYPVFDCAMGERAISPNGHIRMMAAIQPFVSGAISKTVNLPESATVEDIEKTYFDGWKLGLKAIAVYRDGCKVGQPLSDGKAKKAVSSEEEQTQTVKIIERIIEKPARRRLPSKRKSETTSFVVAGADGYLTVGLYEDGKVGEVFVKMSKQGSTLAGIMDALSIAISLGLQYGVPLEAYVAKFMNMRFEPSGMTEDSDIRMAQSLLDYIFRRVALDHLPLEVRETYGIYTTGERIASLNGEQDYEKIPQDEITIDQRNRVSDPSSLPGLFTIVPNATQERGDGSPKHGEHLDRIRNRANDAPLCSLCGIQMVYTGACAACPTCGSTTGCS